MLFEDQRWLSHVCDGGVTGSRDCWPIAMTVTWLIAGTSFYALHFLKVESNAAVHLLFRSAGCFKCRYAVGCRCQRSVLKITFWGSVAAMSSARFTHVSSFI
jgi:hypothetical protein